MMAAREKLLVIGNGMAGARLLSEMAARGGLERYAVTVWGEEKGGAYNRILLSEVLGGARPASALETHAPSWYERHGIELRAGEAIESIEPGARRVRSRAGEWGFDRLVIATGSRAFVPDVPGARELNASLKPGSFAMRTLGDCARIAERASGARRALVVGGGLLGLEAARGLAGLGVGVDLVHRSGHLLNAQLDAAAGALLAHAVANWGIEVHLGNSPCAVIGRGAVEAVELSDGRTLPCDLLVWATGIAPNVELARAAGLPVEKGIRVDDELCVEGHQSIHALGECAQHRGRTYGLVAPGWEQARVLAARLSGDRTHPAYEGSRLTTRLKVLGVEVASIGDPFEAPDDEVVLYTEPKRGVYKKLVIENDRLKGAILLGDATRSAALTRLFERSLPLPEERASLLFSLGGGAERAPEDHELVCNCNGVNAGAIRACARDHEGGASLESVMSATRAGTGCGSCKSQIKALLTAR